MGDKVRVTVIATGIKADKMGLKARPATSPALRSAQQTIKASMLRKERPSTEPVAPPPPVPVEVPDDDLDVPAFMRRRKPEIK